MPGKWLKMDRVSEENASAATWRSAAPIARGLTSLFYAWCNPHVVFVLALFAAAPFLFAAALSPALLSLEPTVDMIAPIALARAVQNGVASIQGQEEPFFLFALMAADSISDAPGRVLLIAKMLSAAIVAIPLAMFSSVRFPAIQATILTAAIAAYVAAPFSRSSDLALAVFIVLAIGVLAPPAEAFVRRAKSEGVLTGFVLFLLWMLNPVFSLIGFLALSACPVQGGKPGAVQYCCAVAMFAVLAAAAELVAPGINIARADMAASLLRDVSWSTGLENASDLAGVAAATGAVIFLAAVFGGGRYVRGWGASLGFLAISFSAAIVAGAGAWPLFLVAAFLASFSRFSPFYEGLLDQSDRASVAVAGAAAALTMFWSLALGSQVVGQFNLQRTVAHAAPEHIRAELAIVQPEGPKIAQWLQEARFSTSEARALFSLAPADQSEMLLAGVKEARLLANDGFDVAILTGADTACVLVRPTHCYENGAAAADAASVVLSPRLDLDPSTAFAKGKAEVLLYSEFKLVKQNALWDVWVRKGAPAPERLSSIFTSAVR